MQELFSAHAYVQTSVTEWDDRFDIDTVFIPLHGSSGGVLFNRKTGKVVPVPYPQYDRESSLQARDNPIRDESVGQIDKLLNAFAIIEEVSGVAAQSVKPAIMATIQFIAAEAIAGRELSEPPRGADIALEAKTPTNEQ